MKSASNRLEVGLRLPWRGSGIVGGAPPFTPASLFSSGEVGAWYDASDLSTMFQDEAGTIPVTAAGQAVARINDKSGRGINALQATPASRPLYQTSGGKHWLEFDGVDDSINSGTANFSTTAQISAFAGVRRLTGGSPRGIVRADATNGFYLTFASAPANGSLANELYQSGASTVVASDTALSVGVDAVVGAQMNRLGAAATNEVVLRQNGAGIASTVNSAGPQADTNFTSAFSLQMPGPFSGNYRMYQVVVLGRALTGGELASLESFINTKTGAY
jgi:hypothetical protein